MDNNFFQHWQSGMPWLADRTIFVTMHGSRAYGTSTPTSDTDYKGVAIPPKEYFLGFHKKFEQAECSKPIDAVIFEIRKFFSLAADCNPNIIEVLHTDPSDWVLCTPLAQKMVEHKADFISKKAKFTFSGYAISQLKRINTHRRWLLNPIESPPKREDYGLPERSLMPRDQLMAAESLIKKRIEEWELDLEPVPPDVRIAVMNRVERMLVDISVVANLKKEDLVWRAAAELVGVDQNFIDYLDRDRRYRSKMQEWKQYQDWKKNRNPARAELEAKFGADMKHASHLVRLMRMCREILENKGVIVKRPDAAELLEIRNGSWTYEKLVEWADAEDKALDELYKTSALPREPNRAKLDQVCMEIVEASF